MMMSLSGIIIVYYGILDLVLNSQGKRYFSTIFYFIYTIFHSNINQWLVVNLLSPKYIFYSSSHENPVKFVVPHMTSNATLKRLWKSETVLVRYFPDEVNKSPTDYNLGDVTMDIMEKQNLKPLKLTPPIVVAWVYHLLRSMTEGITF